MKRVVVVLLAVLLLTTAAMSADQNSWRVSLKADIGPSATSASTAAFGVYPTSLEGWDTQDGTPGDPHIDVVDESTVHIGAVVPGQAGLYYKSIKAPTMPSPEKTWDFYVAGKFACQGTVIRLRAVTLSSGSLPTTTFSGIPVGYALRMVDNKSVIGAPANGTTWDLPTPTAHSATAYWTMPVNLPMIRLSDETNMSLLAEGYKLQFVQMAVPEPSGLLALGGCLVGLAGFIRRRK